MPLNSLAHALFCEPFLDATPAGSAEGTTFGSIAQQL
jgi:hypothetical protein